MVEKSVRQAVNHCQKRLTESSVETPRTRKFVLRATAAVCALICAVIGFLYTRGQNLVATRTGETRPLELEDGSRIVLDTRSRMRVDQRWLLAKRWERVRIALDRRQCYAVSRRESGIA